MKKSILIIACVFNFLIGKSQYGDPGAVINPGLVGIQENYMPGYKSTGIFDTVKAIILIDNKVTKSIQRVEGYACREWKTWYGGIDPYAAFGYKPSPDLWELTGQFLYRNKKLIKAKIWQYEVTANELLPIPKKKEVINSGVSIEPNSTTGEGLITAPDMVLREGDKGILLGENPRGGGTGIGITLNIDTLIQSYPVYPGYSINPTWRTIGSPSKTDTTKVILYADTDRCDKKIRLKKYKAYYVRTPKQIYNSTESPYIDTYYDEYWKKLEKIVVINCTPENW